MWTAFTFGDTERAKASACIAARSRRAIGTMTTGAANTGTRGSAPESTSASCTVW